MKIETYKKAKELQDGIENLEKILGLVETKGIDTVQVCFGSVNTHVKHGMAKQEIIKALEKSKEELQKKFDELGEEPCTISCEKLGELQVGDVVTIRSDLVVGEKYGRVGVCSNMRVYFGKSTKVKCICANGTYALGIDGAFWEWSKQMFEGYENE